MALGKPDRVPAPWGMKERGGVSARPKEWEGTEPGTRSCHCIQRHQHQSRGQHILG